MPLTIYDWVYGSAQLGAVFLSIIAGIVALSMFRHAHRLAYLRAWKLLIIALVLFAVEEILGALKTFGVYSTPHLTHIVPAFIMAFLIGSLIVQINVNRGWMVK